MKTKKPATTTKGKKGKAATKTVKPSTNGKVKLSKKALAAIAWIDQRMKEGPIEGEPSWEEFKAALELNRLGERRLFRD